MYLATKIQNKPRNPFMYYSGFKLAVYYNNEKDRCHPIHSKETATTIPQLLYKKVTEIELDRRAGFEYCLQKARELENRIHHALLYNAYDADLLYGKFIAGKWHMFLQPQFTDDNMIITSRIYSVKNGFAVLHDIEANTLAIQH